MGSSTAVRARGVTKTFGDVVALDSLDIDIEQGRIHGLVGPNGAGKTTLLGLLLGLSAADSGRLEILGKQVGTVHSRPDAVSGFVDGPGLYPSLTARQNLMSVLRIKGLGSRRSQVDQALAQVGLGEVADDHVRGFSLGMRQRLGLASALLSDPGVLVLDEPANGLDPAGKRQVHRILTDLAASGTTVVFSSHRMDDLAALCSDVTVLSTGRIVFSGPPQKLAIEGGLLDYRVVTSDPDLAHRVAQATPGLRVVETREAVGVAAPGSLVVRGPEPAIDALVFGLVGAGLAIRELSPTVAPLEAAYLALTGAGTGHDLAEPEPSATAQDATPQELVP